MSQDDQTARTHDDDEMIFDEIETIIGTFTAIQASTVRRAIRESPAGAVRLARSVAANPKVKRTVAVYLTSIGRGDHLRVDADEHATDRRVPPADAFRRLFTAKVTDLRENTDWTDEAIVEYALDYAVSYVDGCQISGYAPGESALTLEQAMRVTLNRPRPVSDDEQRRVVGRQWVRIVYSLHDPRIAAMYRALRDGCRDPENVTDDEAANVREALIAELDALGVQPRPPASARPVGVGDLQPIGSALVPPGPPLVVPADVAAADDEDLPW